MTGGDRAGYVATSWCHVGTWQWWAYYAHTTTAGEVVAL